MLEIFYSNCEGQEEAARLHGLGDLHHLGAQGVPVSEQAIEIVRFVNVRFDPDRGDKVLLEGIERGTQFKGATQMYPFAEHVRGEGWDSNELQQQVVVRMREREEIRNRVIEAAGEGNFSVIEQAEGEWVQAHTKFVETTIKERNAKCLVPSIRTTLGDFQGQNQPEARLFVVAGQAHFTEDPGLYPTLKQTKYIIYGDPQAEYLQIRARAQQPQRPRRVRRR